MVRRRGGFDVDRLVGRRVVVLGTSGLLLVAPKEGFLFRIVLRLFDPGNFGRFLRLNGRSLLEGGGSEFNSFSGTTTLMLGWLAGCLAGILEVSGTLGEICGLPILVKRFLAGEEAEKNGDDCFRFIVAIV